MIQEFVTQNYLIVEQNIVTNCVLWNGDTTQWTPPVGSIALIQATTSAMVWQLDTALTPPSYVLIAKIGQGEIGYTWDGSVLTTNQLQPQPPIPAKDQPTTSGTTTI